MCHVSNRSHIISHKYFMTATISCSALIPLVVEAPKRKRGHTHRYMKHLIGQREKERDGGHLSITARKTTALPLQVFKCITFCPLFSLGVWYCQRNKCTTLQYSYSAVYSNTGDFGVCRKQMYSMHGINHIHRVPITHS